MKLSERQRDIILHSLGLSRSSAPYRNHFCAGEGHDDLPTLQELVASGHMRASHTINDGRDTIYVVTAAGRTALAAGEEEG